MVFIFIYNILLIVLYTIAMSFAINFYMKNKDKLFLILTLYLAFFILDNIIIYMTEFINSFAHSYNQIFMSIPAAKTIIFMVNAFTSLLIITTLSKEKVRPIHYAFLITMAIWMISVPILPNSPLKVWLYYLPNQLFLFYLGTYAWRKYHTDNDFSETRRKYLKWIALLAMIFAVAIVLEDSFVIFNIDQYTSISIKIYNRNLCEDIFSIGVTLLMIKYFIQDAIREENLAVPMADTQSKDEIFKLFCRQYQLTQREVEILKLLLDHKQNQEIADELFLSIGTVKTHVHNIFIKMDIKKRNQIIPLYELYTSSSDEVTENS